MQFFILTQTKRLIYGPNGIICQQKDHSLLADRFEPLIYSFAIKLTIPIVT
jgi:hypothetical protein